MSDDLEDAEGGGESGGEDGGGGGFNLKKLLLFVVAPVIVLLLGGGGAAYYFGLFDSFLGGSEQAAAPEGEAGGPGGPGYFYDLDEILVSMGSTGRKTNFLKMRISLELERKEDEARIKAVLPRILDSFQVFLRNLRLEELQGSHGLYRVREELLARVNAAAYPAKVRDVLFKEMLVQ